MSSRTHKWFLLYYFFSFTHALIDRRDSQLRLYSSRIIAHHLLKYRLRCIHSLKNHHLLQYANFISDYKYAIAIANTKLIERCLMFNKWQNGKTQR